MEASVFVGVSVDGFLARRDGSFDFLPDKVEPHGFEEFFASVDALLIGRGTYDVVRAFPTWPYGDKTLYVLSTKPLAPSKSPHEVVRLEGDPAGIWKELETRGHRHVYVDGGLTIQAFLRAGLITRLVVTRVPVLIGEGIPLFGPTGRDVALRHVGTRTFPSGLVQSTYELA